MRLRPYISPVSEGLRKRLALGTAVLTAIAPVAAHSEPPGNSDALAVETLFDAFAANSRRSYPNDKQLEWRTRAGQVDQLQWPSEILLRELEPMLTLFFGALHGREFVADQTESLFAENFRGTELQSSSLLNEEAGSLTWSRWQLSDEPRLDRNAFVDSWKKCLQQYGQVIRTEQFVDSITALDDGRRLRLEMPFRLTGTHASSKAGKIGYEDQGHMSIEVIKEAGDAHWRIQEIDVKSMESLRSPTLFKMQTLSEPAAVPDVPLTAYVDYFAEGVSVVDFDSDGDLDVFAPVKFGPATLYRNDGGRTFTNVSEITGIANVREARSGYFFDWDNDGDQDALLLTARRLYLLEYRDGKFNDVSSASHFDRMSTTGLTGATVADYNNDGLLDFYVANYGDLASSPVLDYFNSHRGFKNQLFLNSGSGQFRMTTVEAGLDDGNDRWSFAALSFDYDDDGDQDLYVVNDYGPNQLFRNMGDARFEEVTATAGGSDYGNGMAVSLGDLNGDGHEDLYVSNMISHAGKRLAASDDFPDDDAARDKLRRFAKGNTLLVATGRGFQEVESPAISDAKWAWGSVLFDYDNDADLDIYVTNGMYSNLRRQDTDPVFWRHLLAPISTGVPPVSYATGYFSYLLQQESYSFAGYERNRLFQNFGDGVFRDVAATTGTDLVLDSRSVVAADFDGDGRQDLVVASRNDPKLLVYWNELEGVGQFLELELEGQRSNRDGVGAVVEVQCGDRVQRRTHVSGSGYLSQGPQRLSFGLGACSRVDRVSVDWPSGAQSQVNDVRAGSRLRIREEKK